MPDTDVQNRRPEYEERVVALIDVLGWRDLLNEDCDGPPECAWNALERMQKEISSQADAESSGHYMLADRHNTVVISPNPDIQLSQFSDHMLLSCKAEGFDPGNMIDQISRLLWAVLAEGMLVRGAVVVGKICHSSSMALGPALVRAHHLESEVAVYPRVIVEEAVQNRVNFGNPVQLASWIGTPVKRAPPVCRDRDGLLYLDFLRRRLDDGRLHDRVETWQGIRDSLLERRTQHTDSPKILAKNAWMIAYFNEVVRQIPQLASLEIG
jgi:hypothetical protein